jgi:23S rRNA pseudouridine2604 synthase
VDGTEITPVTEDIMLVFNKPRGVTCTADRSDPSNVIDYIGYPKRIYTIGRLDKDSEGLLLLTNNGDLANEIMRSRAEHEKEYIVTVDRPITDEFIEGMSNGVPILDGRITKKCEVRRIDSKRFRIVLRQGLNRQIRRMCEYFGYDVRRLVRVRIINIELGDLPQGRYRDMTSEERKELMRRLGL